jgi:hypothetical protein
LTAARVHVRISNIRSSSAELAALSSLASLRFPASGDSRRHGAAGADNNLTNSGFGGDIK